MVQVWFRSGSGMVHVWFRYGSGLVHCRFLSICYGASMDLGSAIEAPEGLGGYCGGAQGIRDCKWRFHGFLLGCTR